MPKISPLDQNLWPTDQEQTDTQPDTQRKQTPLFQKKVSWFRFSFEGALR